MPTDVSSPQRAPRTAVPENACDCHIHILDSAFPPAPTAAFVPPDAPVAAYRAVQRRLGLERVIVVQPSVYGFDPRCVLAALTAFGAAARGVIVPDPAISDDELRRLDLAGVRGVRFHMLPGGLLPWEALLPMAARIAPLGWFVQVQLDGRNLPERIDTLSRLPVPLMIDHIGKFLEPVAPDHAGFRALLKLIDGGNTYVKLAAPYETSKTGAPDYRDVGALAAALVAAAPERMVWASNWPHISPDPTRPKPDEAGLLDLLATWAPDEAVRRRILVDNPARLYRF